MEATIFDIETDGLLDNVTKIHCLSYTTIKDNKIIHNGSITDYNKMINFIQVQNILVGHNIIQYDIPVLEKILSINITCKTIDTLAVAYYLQPYRKEHNLESYAKDYDTAKIEIDDWDNLSIEEYIERCEKDVEINTTLFKNQYKYLLALYTSESLLLHFLSYLSFKFKCLSHHREIKIPLDIISCKKYLSILEKEYEDKFKTLQEIMPKDLGKIIKKKPVKFFKKDGTLSTKGLQWVNYLSENNLPQNTTIIREEPNPRSVPQLKEWLFKIGWNPITFKESKTTGEKVPQISLPFGQGLCFSVIELYEKEPKLEALDGLYKINHRISKFKAFLEYEKDSKVFLNSHGFTNTLRLKHSKPCENIPKPSEYYGKELREVLVIPNEDYIMIGADISGLEDNTKRHLIYPYDPKYVEEMSKPGFDPHLDIGVLAGLITKEEAEYYKWADTQENLEDKTKFSKINKKRFISKTSNFAMTYNAFPPKIADTAKISLEEAENLFNTYWERNKAIKYIVRDTIIKKINNQKWLYNPVSGFWIFLKHDKDIFSSLNQNLGVFIFDSWLYQVRKFNIDVAFQYHDEIMIYCKKSEADYIIKCLHKAMEIVNKNLKLNVQISISVKLGNNYAEVH